MAALPPAGVDLQAKNFSDYIRKLDTIEKKNREVFDTEFKGTGKSFTQVTKAAKSYEQQLKKTNDAQKQAAREAGRLAEAQKTAAATQRTAAISTANVILDVAKQVATFAGESAKLAAQFKGQQLGLQNLARSFGQSGSEIQAAIQTASAGTISGLQAIEAANTALLLGVAQTPKEFERITKVATTLGRALGLTAERSIERFTTGLGRQSKLIIDDLGISTSALDAEIEKIAQRDFGALNKSLTQAQQASVFTAAALSLGEEKMKALGDEAGKAQASFERLAATSENLQVTFGEAIRPQAAAIADALARAFVTAQQLLAIAGGLRAAFASLFDDALKQAELRFKQISGIAQNFLNQFRKVPLEIEIPDIEAKTFDQAFQDATTAGEERFKDIASTIAGVSFENDTIDGLTDAFEDQADAIGLSTDALRAYQNIIRQAEQLQLSFTRAAEDTALKLVRVNEDIARKQKRQRDKLLKTQVKQLDDFERDRRKQITKIEDERRQAGVQRKRDQDKLQRELRQAQERFNLSRLQSERRFGLSEKRLRAEGDILALQQLREDRDLERQEEKENFDLSKKEQISSTKEQQREQAQDLEKRITTLKTNLEDQRAELLRGFDEQLIAQQTNFVVQAQDRSIALTREEQDRRISQARQLQDLGISFANQKDITTEGTLKVADEIGKIFGQAGVADQIITGFTVRTESDFKQLFDNLENIVSGTQIGSISSGGASRQRFGGIPEFDEGGRVPGPVGSPQLAVVHGGETITPPQQTSFQMAAPVIPSQELNVNMSGGFNITGDGQADETILQAAATEMTENLKIAVRRLARRN